MTMTNTEKIKRIEELTDELNATSILYDKGFPVISDKEWDEKYFELKQLEEEIAETKSNSPTQSIPFVFVTELKKVSHNHPMLSLDKTKDLTTIKNFIGSKRWIAMAKMDGLTCSLHYINGELISAETRGNGIEGEDVTHNAMVISSIPKIINYKKELIVDGEIICTYKNFEKFSTSYKNPRNFASGSIRLLDSEECYKRNLTFVAWDVIKGFETEETLTDKIIKLRQYNFITVPLTICNSITPTIEDAVIFLKEHCSIKSYPIDGIVFKYDNIKEYNAAGRTDHHFKGGIAYKFYDETYSTKLKHIEWTMGRTGVLTPVAIFDPVEIEGSIVERASLHNVSIMKQTLGDCAYVDEPLKIYKANMIIPQVAEAGPKYNHDQVIAANKVPANDSPEFCPICNKPVEYIDNSGVITLICSNPACDGKLINRLDHFAGKKGLDIKGLSKSTFEKLIDWGWINNLQDIFTLKEHRKEWINKSGFGIASVDKILNAIEASRKTTMSKYISALGIPMIGKVAAEALEQKFLTYESFKETVTGSNKKELYNIPGIGEVMIDTILNYDFTEADFIFKNFIQIEQNIIKEEISSDLLKNMIFCITGKTRIYKNRDELANVIKSYGGKVTSSVTSKTTYLINDDINSKSSKNVTAKKLHIPIINEDEFLTLITPPNEKIEPSYLASAT